MTKAELFEDYNKICGMNADIDTKVRLLSVLLTSQGNPWRVVGITREALIIFKKYRFIRQSGMGVHRSHLYGRSETYKKMMNIKFINADQWWKYFYARDKTVLATSSENMKSSKLDFYKIPNNAKLFNASGYAWIHGEREIEFLNKLYKEKIVAPNRRA